MKSIIRVRLIAIFLAVTALAMVLMISQRAVKAAPPSGASVTGTIKLDGTAPHQKPIDMSKEPSCAAIHKDKPITTETVVAGADGALANVVVYVSQGLSGAAASETASSTPIWNQKGCQYIPHVMALDVNQHFK
ncbi:MAG TPA: hypothetical protein VIL63_00850, partial [Terriglobales bacterium]